MSREKGSKKLFIFPACEYCVCVHCLRKRRGNEVAETAGQTQTQKSRLELPPPTRQPSTELQEWADITHCTSCLSAVTPFHILYLTSMVTTRG